MMAELLAAGEAFKDALAWICLRGAAVLFAALALWRVGKVVFPPYDWMAQIDGLPTTPVMSTARERWTCIADKLVMIDNESGLLGTCDEGFGTEFCIP